MKPQDPKNPMSRSQSGRMGKAKSTWRYGFGLPLSAADKDYQTRVNKWQKENK